jgi:hypothetical protein
MSPLERHRRLLLRAYPAEYRRTRGEEIVDTLLEATPERRDWPRLRDACSLVAGGLRARAALAGGRDATAGARVGAFVGVAAYLTLLAAANLASFLPWMHAMPLGFRTTGWSALAQLLLVAVVAVAWVSRNRRLAAAGAVLAGAAISYTASWRGYDRAATVAELLCLAALVALSGDKRPDWRWLWPIGTVLAFWFLAHPRIEHVLARLVMLQPHLAAAGGPWLRTAILVAIGISSIAWLKLDGRTAAVALATFFLAAWLAAELQTLTFGAADLAALVLPVGIAAIAAPLLWRMRRQSAL